MLGRRWFWVVVVVAAALAVPCLAVIPPSLFFRRDDFAWLSWASGRPFWDAFHPGLAHTTPGGRFRPVHALFWILGSDALGTASAAPWILLSSAFFAAALVLMLLWGDARDPDRRLAGKAAVGVWFAAFLPVAFLFLNVYNNGKTMTLFFLPLAIRSAMGAIDGRGRRFAWIAATAALLAFLTREASLVIFPVTVAVYALASRKFGHPRGLRLFAISAGIAAVALGAWALSPLIRDMTARLVSGALLRGLRPHLEYYLSVTFFAGYRKFLWTGLLLLVSGRRRIYLVLAPGALVAAALSPLLSMYLISGVVLLYWATRPDPWSRALLAWFLAGYIVVVHFPLPTYSYVSESSYALALFFGSEVSPMAARVRSWVIALGARTPRWPLRIATGVLVIVLAAPIVSVGGRVYRSQLLPIKAEGRDFAGATRYMSAELPPESDIYVLAGADYPADRAEYKRRMRIFYVWPQTSFSFFKPLGRPGMRLVKWTGRAPPPGRPAYYFATNRYEKERLEEDTAGLSLRLLFENRSCSVYTFAD